MPLDVIQPPKIALVTGAAKGIGKSLAQSFAVSGYHVLALDCLSKPDDLQKCKYLRVDLARLVSSPSYAAKNMSKITELIGDNGLDVLVNNAAIQVLGGVETLLLDDWRKTLDINLLAPFVLTQALLPQLEAAEGCVINISSIHARLTKPNFVAYATSKAALSGMTRAMAVDLGGRVRVNAIEPAAISTEMLKAGFDGQSEKLTQLEACHPQGRIGTPEEVAALALSIASGDLRFMHGACVPLDGGISGRLHDPI